MTSTLSPDATPKACITDAVKRSVESMYLTSTQAAKVLGVSSPNTVKNWLEGGEFPGAFKTRGGHWRFLRLEVEAVKSRLDNLSYRNLQRDLTPLDVDDDFVPPLS
jgi:excisionase family DNA binding protein